MNPEASKPPPSADQRSLTKELRQEADLIRNVLRFSLWTLVALAVTMILLLADMTLLWRVITGIICAAFWLMALAGMFRLTGLLDAGSQPISFNPFHAGKGKNDQTKKE